MLFAQMIFATWKQDFIKEKADEPFKGYVHHLQQHAAYLNDTNYHVDNLILHNAIEQMYAPALHNHIEVKECANDTETVAFLALSFKDWVAIVNCRDTQLKQKKKELATQVAALKRSAASTLGEPSRHYNTTPHLSSQHANLRNCCFPIIVVVISAAYLLLVTLAINAQVHSQSEEATSLSYTLKNVTAAVVLMSIVSTMDYDVGAIFPSASADALYANLSNGSNDSDYVPSDVEINGLFYMGDRLMVPNMAHHREDIFQLMHNAMGHFGTRKSYMLLHDSYYWPAVPVSQSNEVLPACEIINIILTLENDIKDTLLAAKIQMSTIMFVHVILVRFMASGN
ncbi:hypothetical protein FISHEDRAFT_74419 [Fistulina hepatica ATCC 64428]|uniref:Integrase zinc-binding domain-containing protein n=1 Tax=Fistulina hepatica ATCC 64428 TaxID=1128425 RepID=A0A0D7ACE8_9AGAR|nr:hypothetical protein FISHEDRAFT_74419 [Fistulina hepatica ATCC 64428]